MTAEFEILFSTPVRFRIIEKRTKILEDFVTSINEEKLLSLPCKPDPRADRKRCFVNVEERIRRQGGTILTGWMFKEFEGRSIEGEAHAVWMDPFAKKRLDITPHDFQPKRILFLPDARVALKRGYTAPPKLLISDNPYLAAIEKFDSSIQKLRENKFTKFGNEMIITLDEYEMARDDAKLPDDVAMHLINKFHEADVRAWKKHGSNP